MIETLLLLLICLTILLYLCLTKHYGYFRKHGVPEVPSYFPFGSDEAWRVWTGRVSFIHATTGIYEQYKNLPMVGYNTLGTPILIVNDLDLAKSILIKDFEHFMDRREFSGNESVHVNKYANNLLSLMKGDKWRQMRSTMSPIFTTGKLKAMSKLVNKVNGQMIDVLTEKAANQADINVKEIMALYTMDAIISCGFGVESNAMTQPEDNKFVEMVKLWTGMGKTKPVNVIKLLLLFAAPKLFYHLKLSILNEVSTNFFVDIIRQSLTHRSTTKERRNDFIDLSLDALKSKMSSSKVDNEDGEQMFSEEEMELYLVSSLFLLFFAGFDTSSTTTSVTLHFLAEKQDVQERLFNEISEKLESIDIEDLDYNAVQSLPYLDMVVNEALRIWPIGFLERKCTKPYKVPGTNFTIPAGMLVQIPYSGIMRDQQYYKNPNDFDPENFSPENKAKRNPYAFLAFGQGPRKCLGIRFAFLTMKLCLVRLIYKFKVLPSHLTPSKLEVDPLDQSAMPKGGVFINLEER